MAPDGKKWKRVWVGNEKLKEATMTIEIPDDQMKNLRCKKISFETLMNVFSPMFMEPKISEVFYKEIEGGWRVSFVKNNILVYCDVLATDIVQYYATEENNEISEEDKANLVIGWKDRFLVKAIKEE